MAQPPLDGFSALPEPVLELILIQLDDLSSLYGSYRSSPAIFYLLHEDGTARRIIPKDVDDFIQMYITEDTGFDFPRDTALPALCDTIAAAATIRYLAHAGMHEMIARCQRLELKQLQNPKLKYIRNVHRTPSLWNAEYYPVPKPPRERYLQADAAPISVVEEQRAIHALCLVTGPSRHWNWSSEEVSRFQTMHFEELWRHALWNTKIEPIRTTDKYRLIAVKNLTCRAGWKLPCDCPVPSASSIREADETELWRTAPGYSFMLGRLSKWFTPPYRYVRFRPFRRYGFAIWSLRRMQGLGHLSAPGDRPQLPQAPRSEPDQYVDGRAF
ncbi:hypothetical protein BDW72DRAFT_211293 [Aspergillus terricola var. indicus]